MSRAGEPTPAVTPSLESAYDACAAASVTWVAGLLAAASALLAVPDAFLLEGSDRSVALGICAAAVLVLGGLCLGAWRRPLPPHLGQPVACAAVLVAAVHPIVVMMLTRTPSDTVSLVVVAASAGAALLSVRWLVGTLYVVWGGWTSAALLAGPTRDWLTFGVGLALATGLAIVVAAVRRKACRDVADARASVEAAAVRDQLTGLANRRGLAMVGAQIVEHARRQGDAAHCLFVDVAGLRTVNEVAGHDAGDEVLVSVAEALREVTRATDVVARWGGDEFCVVGPGPGMAPLELERRVRETVLLSPPLPAEVWPVRISAGGSMLAPWDAGTLETLLGSADQELHLRRSLRRETGSRSTPRAASAD